jgi:hypothetical protein
MESLERGLLRTAKWRREKFAEYGGKIDSDLAAAVPSRRADRLDLATPSPTSSLELTAMAGIAFAGWPLREGEAGLSTALPSPLLR